MKRVIKLPVSKFKNALPGERHARWSALLVLLLAGLVFLSFTEAAVPEEKPVKGGGTLTSIESDGAVIINGKRYLMSFSAQILDWRKFSVSLNKFSLPARVYFEFEQTQGGPIIKVIKEIPQ